RFVVGSRHRRTHRAGRIDARLKHAATRPHRGIRAVLDAALDRGETDLRRSARAICDAHRRSAANRRRL
ncbi:hypothetical protein AB4084_30220, partial [Lysobacter sp. 2RAB21]